MTRTASGQQLTVWNSTGRRCGSSPAISRSTASLRQKSPSSGHRSAPEAPRRARGVRSISARCMLPGLNIAAAVTGTAASLALDGSAAITATEQGHVVLVAEGVEAAGNYRLDAHLDPGGLRIRLTGQEPSHGLISKIAGLPDLGPLSVDAALLPDRARPSWLSWRLAAGALRAAAQGTVDLEHQPGRSRRHRDCAGDDATAGSVVAVDGARRQDRRPIRPARCFGHARCRGAEGAGAVRRATLRPSYNGDSGAVRLYRNACSEFDIPGPQPDLLAAAPVRGHGGDAIRPAGPPDPLFADASFDHSRGRCDHCRQLQGKLKLDAPEPGAAGGAGRARSARPCGSGPDRRRSKTEPHGSNANGTLGITGGMAPVPALIGDAAHLTVSAAATGSNVTVSRL